MKKILFPLLLFTLLLSACQKEKVSQHRIMVSIEPLRYFVEAIAGDEWTVSSMVPKGSSPETYEPSPQQMIDISNSDFYFSIGYLNFETTWLEKFKSNAPQLKVCKTAESAFLIHSTDTEHEKAHAHAVDPHVWMSTQNAQVIAKNICLFLCHEDSTHAKEYMQRYQQLATQIQAVDDSIHALTDNKPQRAFFIYHPALTYMSKEYGWKQFSIEEDGKEPTPQHLSKLIQTAKEENIQTIFVQQEFDKRNAQSVARETHLTISEINPLNYQWDKEMLNITHTLYNSNNK